MTRSSSEMKACYFVSSLHMPSVEDQSPFRYLMTRNDTISFRTEGVSVCVIPTDSVIGQSPELGIY